MPGVMLIYISKSGIWCFLKSTLYPIEYVHAFVVRCFVWVILSAQIGEKRMLLAEKNVFLLFYFNLKALRLHFNTSKSWSLSENSPILKGK